MDLRESDVGELSGRHNRSVKHLLLDRRFQLKYVAMIVGVATLISAVLGAFLYQKVRENSRMLELEAAADALFQEQLAAQDWEILLSIALAFVAFLVALALLALLVTHRMAGPIYVMSRHVRTLAKGRIPAVRQLRKGDEFGELYEELGRAVEAIHRRTASEVEVLARAAHALEAMEGEEAAKARAELAALLAQKRAALAPAEASAPVPTP